MDGVYDRDPRLYPDAVRFGRISYEAMLKLIENGAQVPKDALNIAAMLGIDKAIIDGAKKYIR